MARVHLIGAEHDVLGDLAAVAAAPGVDVAISRGARPKEYSVGAPNEDVVAAVAGPDATLLAVADAFTGPESSRAAIEAVLAAAGDPPPPALEVGQALDLLEAANEAALEVTAEDRAAFGWRGASRTTLVVAHLAGRRLTWAAMKDSAIFVARPAGGPARRLDTPTSKSISFPMTRADLEAAASCGAERLEPGDAVVLVTDGFTDVAGRHELADLAAAGRLTAEAVVALALERDTSDNVAAAVAHVA
jgi:serine/threonine protein phosphatase PrpC